ncbi:nuclear transport factor 2 family protein [Agrobacterium sp. GD03638]|nr:MULTISPECIES: nuclear transport factor 2 family protein [unclassified Agrobacterium]MDH2210110.1 nuclear transport factor 2 family protein [Agrobacterium sp. GD03643]MDH2219609.1 nuclear transport factor 2 family protein [Agrobacterium sp. GD03638]
MAYADESLMRDVFDPRASIVGTFEGEIEWLSLEDFVDQMRKKRTRPARSRSRFRNHGYRQGG